MTDIEYYSTKTAQLLADNERLRADNVTTPDDDFKRLDAAARDWLTDVKALWPKSPERDEIINHLLSKVGGTP